MFWWKRLKPDDPQKRAELKESIRKEGGLEKHDFFAMVVSAFLVLFPIAVLLLVVLCLVVFLPFLF